MKEKRVNIDIRSIIRAKGVAYGTGALHVAVKSTQLLYKEKKLMADFVREVNALSSV